MQHRPKLDETDSFESIAGLQVQLLLSKLVAEHQSRIGSLQTELKLLYEKLGERGRELNPELTNALQSDHANVSTIGRSEGELNPATACISIVDVDRLAQEAGTVDVDRLAQEAGTVDVDRLAREAGTRKTNNGELEERAAHVHPVRYAFQSDDARSPTNGKNIAELSPASVNLQVHSDRARLPAQSPGTIVSHQQTEKSRAGSPAKVDWATTFHRHSATNSEVMHRNPSDHDVAVKRLSLNDRLQQLVRSNTFEIISGSVILANAMLMAIQQEYEGLDVGHVVRPSTHTRPAAEEWPGAGTTFMVLDLCFTAVFCIELLLRFFAYRYESIFMAWMWFDSIVIVLGLLDFIFGEGGIGIDPSMIRLVRLVRLSRLLRLLRTMSMFDSLFLLLKAIRASVAALAWSFLILALVMTTISLFMSQMLHGFVTDVHGDDAKRDKAFQLFGTFSKAMLTMFEITLANWVPVCRFLIEDVHEGFFVFFIVYRCMFCFAVLKVIAAVFISETNRVMTSDSELTVMRSRRDAKLFKTRVAKVLEAIDEDGDGTISWDEMLKFLMTNESSAWLVTIGVDRADFEKLFWLTEVDEHIEISKFLNMVGQLRGQAKTVDLLNLFKLLHKLDQKLHTILPIEEEDDMQQKALAALAEGAQTGSSDDDSELSNPFDKQNT